MTGYGHIRRVQVFLYLCHKAQRLKKILIIRFSSIGDIILTTPVIRCLAKQMPNVEIHYLTKKSYAEILTNNPYINKVIVLDESLNALIPRLKAENYDHIVDLHKNMRSVYTLARLRKPFSTFSKLNIRKLLLVKSGINMMPPIHIADRYMTAVRRFGVINDGLGLDFFISAADEVDLKMFPEIFRKGYFGFVIGGKFNTKILPAEKVIEIIREVKLPVILFGGAEDFERGEEIKNVSADMVINACGRFSLMQSASLVKQATAIVTNDTGLMHVAAAFNKKIISVWGNTVPEFGMYPYKPLGVETETVIAEVSGLKCRPCSKIGFEKCPKGHFRCMIDQNTVEISRQLNELSSSS
jgi:ADP-heptose:LPS heptosyltransferase